MGHRPKKPRKETWQDVYLQPETGPGARPTPTLGGGGARYKARQQQLDRTQAEEKAMGYDKTKPSIKSRPKPYHNW